jgi:hypothetical protein
MKRFIILPTIAFATLFVGAAAVASAQDHRCSNPGLTGAWGYTENGTVVPPAVSGQAPVLGAAVGRYDFDAAGKFTGTQYSSAGGTVSADTKIGTYELNSTGHLLSGFTTEERPCGGRRSGPSCLSTTHRVRGIAFNDAAQWHPALADHDHDRKEALSRSWY